MVHQYAGIERTGQLTTWFAEPAQGERSIDVDQTNTSVVVGERAVVKWLNAPVPGRQPAPERLQLLAEAGFTQIPRPWGLLHDRSGALQAIVTAYLPETTDGWEWGPTLVRALASKQITMDEALEPIRGIGELVGRMHGVFARHGVSWADSATTEAWYERACQTLNAAQLGIAALVGEDGPEAERLRSLAPQAGTYLQALRQATGTALIWIHGDLHVGQILRSDVTGELHVIDFDGNPVLSLEERLSAQPAAVDVAGMLCSIDHVGRVVMYRTPEFDPTIVRQWMSRAENCFLQAYQSTLPDRTLLDTTLIPALRVQQEAREYLYAAGHLPHWRYVPDSALPDLLSNLASTDR